MSDSKGAAFVPLLPPGGFLIGKSDMRRVYRNAVEQALSLEPCSVAISAYKCNGNKLGHKVLDTAEAVKALIRVAPENLKPALEIPGLNLFEKAQQLDVVMRRHWAQDKFGKFPGGLSRKAQLRANAAAQGGAAKA